MNAVFFPSRWGISANNERKTKTSIQKKCPRCAANYLWPCGWCVLPLHCRPVGSGHVCCRRPMQRRRSSVHGDAARGRRRASWSRRWTRRRIGMTTVGPRTSSPWVRLDAMWPAAAARQRQPASQHQPPLPPAPRRRPSDPAAQDEPAGGDGAGERGVGGGHEAPEVLLGNVIRGCAGCMFRPRRPPPHLRNGKGAHRRRRMGNAFDLTPDCRRAAELFRPGPLSLSLSRGSRMGADDPWMVG